MKIGVFDSGVGGLIILKEIMSLIPKAEYFYIADDLHVPYGTKGRDFIVERSKYCVDELREKGCELVVVACNTATASAIEDLRKTYAIPFVGIEPDLNFLSREKIEGVESKKIAVLTTILTG